MLLNFPFLFIQGERILKLSEMCRRLETEEEKVYTHLLYVVTMETALLLTYADIISGLLKRLRNGFNVLHEIRAYGGEKFMSSENKNNVLKHSKYHTEVCIFCKTVYFTDKKKNL